MQGSVNAWMNSQSGTINMLSQLVLSPALKTPVTALALSEHRRQPLNPSSFLTFLRVQLRSTTMLVSSILRISALIVGLLDSTLAAPTTKTLGARLCGVLNGNVEVIPRGTRRTTLCEKT